MTQETLRTSITGYGLVFKDPMKNKALTIEAKAIYAYLAAYAGSTNVAFPSVELIVDELGISENRFHKNKKILIEQGYLSVHRERTENGFSKNIYTLNHHPVTLQNEGIGNEVKETVTRQNVGIQSVGISDVGIGNVSLQNEGTIINSLTSNSITNNSNKNNSLISNSSRSDLKSTNNLESDTTTTTDNDFKEVYNSYQENIQMNPPPNVNQKLAQDFEEYGKELMLYAIYRSSLKNNHNYTFIDHLLNDWRKNRITTADRAKKYEEHRDGKYVGEAPAKAYTPEELERMEQLRNVSENMWSFIGAD